MIEFTPKTEYSKHYRGNRTFFKQFLSGKARTERERQARAGHCKACKPCESLACVISEVSFGGGFMLGCLLSGFLGMSEGHMNWQGGSLTLKTEGVALQSRLHLPIYRGSGHALYS